MLTPGALPAIHRAMTGHAGRPAHQTGVAGPRTGSRRPGPRWITAVVALASAIALPVMAAGPASADQARQRQQWVLSALDVTAAWQVTQGRGVTVAVIDSGVDPSVSDLTGSVRPGPDYTGAHTPPSNQNWGAHGTWMASLIAGHGHGRGNRDGILGVAPKARILSIRVITDNSDPGYHAYFHQPAWRGQRELAKAIKYAVDHGAGVISMSLGYDEASRAVRSALQSALEHNVVVVASSGNAGKSHAAGHGNAPYSFPADYPGVIGVAAVTQSGRPAYFSSENLSVQVAAPGVNVPAQGRSSKYWVVSGTSPACALTAGVAALIKSRFPKMTAAQVRSAITGSSANRPKDGYSDRVGFGTVDAAAALKLARRLAKQTPAGQTQAGQGAASGNFGGGQDGVPAFPVAPRGREKVLVLGGIAAGGVLLLVIAVWLLARSRRRRRAARKRGPIGVTATQGPIGAVGKVGPMSPAGPGQPVGTAAPRTAPGPVGPGRTELDVHYPTQIYPAQRPGLPVQGYISQPAEGLPVHGFLGQQGQTQFGPGQGATGPGVPGPGSPPQPWPAQPGPAQPGPGQPGPGQAGPPGQPGLVGPPGQPGQAGFPGQPGPAGNGPVAQPGSFGALGQFGQPGQSGLPAQLGGPAQPDPRLPGPGYAEVSQPPSPSGYIAPGVAGPGPAGPGNGPGAASPGFPPPAYQDGTGAGSGYPGKAGSAAPANGVSGTLPAAAGISGDSSDSEWPFEDEPGSPAASPAATAITAAPGHPAQSAPPVQSDPHARPGQRPVGRPGRTVLPPPDADGSADEDPLTSPRYSRDGRAERALRRGGYRPDWLPSGQGVTKPMSSPRRPGQAGEPGQPGPGQLPKRTRQPVQAERASQPDQPSSAASASPETAAAKLTPGMQAKQATSPVAQSSGAGPAESAGPHPSVLAQAGPTAAASPASASGPARQHVPPTSNPGGGPSATASAPGQLDESASRSIWEPLARNRSNPSADPASAEAAEYAGPTIKTGPSAWQTRESRQPARFQRDDATSASSEAPVTGAQTVSDPVASEGTPTRSVSGQAPSPRAESATGPGGQRSFGAALPWRETQQGPDGLPKRQPMTHLAAPLRRDGPAAESQQPASGGPLPSVWDTWRPTSAAKPTGQQDGSDTGDDQA